MPSGSVQYFTYPECGRNSAAHQNQISPYIKMGIIAGYKSRLTSQTSLQLDHETRLSPLECEQK